MNQMNVKMIIKVLPAEGSNPEFAPGAELQEGIECHGYILMTFNKEHELETSLITNLSIQNISDAIEVNCNEAAITIIRQACVIAEGYIKAAKMGEDHMREKMVQRMKKVLSGIDPDAEFLDELTDEFPDDEIQRFPEEE